MERCEFYPDGKHQCVKTFWGMACDRCGRVKGINETEAERIARERPAREKVPVAQRIEGSS